MALAIIFSIVLGVCAVVQAGLNKQFGEHWSLSISGSWNMLVATVVAFIFAAFAKFNPQSVPEIFRIRGDFTLSSISWVHLLPGIMGFVIVFGFPYAISKVGALTIFVGAVAVQILTSIIWDVWIEGDPINSLRIVGAVLAIIGAFFVFFSGSQGTS